MSTVNSKRIKKLADLDELVPGLAKLWPAIKAICVTRQRAPKYVYITDDVREPMPDDYDCCKRIALDLRTMELGGSVHVSCGEWATLNRGGVDRAVEGVPDGAAILTCTWNDYHRSFTMEIQVQAGALAKELAPKSVAT